ncbi:MAG: thiamine phosphate synthase [Planctomycetia bacterium]|nr:thiamine phosphate synthase [Planctomycetia bacterium]
MKLPFTPAVERALDLAAEWSSGDALSPIDVPEILLALLAEPELLASRLLLEVGIDGNRVLERWPTLTRTPENAKYRRGQFEPTLREAMQHIKSFLPDLGEIEIGTQHLLWACGMSEHDAGNWMRERGIRVENVVEIRDDSPLQFPFEDLDDDDDEDEDEEPTPPAIVRDEPENAVAVWRTLDAAGNRAREGLRVAEDYVRFSLDDRHLTEQLKSLRHDLSAALEQLPAAERLSARDTPADVGTSITLESESHRTGPASVATASLKRTGEALRSLEEFGKVVDAAFAVRIESLRYRLYTLEKAIGITADSKVRLAHAKLYVLLDGRESLAAFTAFAGELIAAGVHVIQLRDKKLADRELLERARALQELTANSHTLFILNDRPDLAVLAEADGVHVGQEELSVKDARRIVGPTMLVGVSTHSLDQARQAVLDGASYIGVGPTFPSQTKQFAEFTGVELLRSVAENIRLPAFAIGGITLERLDAVLATGIQRVAVSAAITQSKKPTKVAAAFLTQLNCASTSPQRGER